MGGYTRSEEPALILRIQQGDDSAFEQIVKKNHEMLMRRAMQILGNRERGEDAVQNTYIKAWRSLVTGKFRGNSSIDTWLYRIVSNAARDERKRFRPYYSLVDNEGVSRFVSHNDPTRKAEYNELCTQIIDESHYLRPKRREIFLSRAVGGLNYKQIAQKYGWRIGTVKGELHRARREIEQRLGHQNLRPSVSDHRVHDRRGRAYRKL
jgi:RNA polymerase sigma-70 factor, ECF subfamily